MEFGVELKLDNRQFSLLRAEVRSGSGLSLMSLAPPSETKLLQLLTMSDYSPDNGYSFSHKISTLVLGLLTSCKSWTTVTVNMSLTRKMELVRD